MNGTAFPGGQEYHGGGYTSTFQGEGGGGGYQGNRQQGGGRKFDFKPKPEDLDPTLYLSAAITGNKDASPAILSKIAELARYLESKGFVIRVGGDGPVEEAGENAVSKKELILPWKEFGGKVSQLTWATERAHHIAKAFHPMYDTMKKGVQGILAKNARLVMGHKMMSPASLLLVYTEDGVEELREVTTRTGFAGHPIKIARAANIPVFNLGKPDAESRLRNFVETSFPKA